MGARLGLLAERGEITFIVLSEIHQSTEHLQIRDQRFYFRDSTGNAIEILVTGLF